MEKEHHLSLKIPACDHPRSLCTQQLVYGMEGFCFQKPLINGNELEDQLELVTAKKMGASHFPETRDICFSASGSHHTPQTCLSNLRTGGRLQGLRNAKGSEYL